MHAIETSDLTKEYRPPGRVASALMRSPIKNSVLALDRVNLMVEPGELFGLIGPNGAGKTTLVKILCTLLLPSSGRAVVGGHDVCSEECLVQRSVGFVAGEERSFHWRLTGRQNLEFFAALSNMFGREARRRIDELMERLGIAHAAENMVYSYSSGMKQRLALARGLLTDPEVLFLDEPTRSLDPLAARRFKLFIRERLVRDEGRTVFLTSHRLEDIEQMCDRFAVLRGGRLTFCGTVNELRQRLRPREHYLIHLSGLDETEVVRLSERHSLRDVSLQPNGEPRGFALRCAFPNGDNLLPALVMDLTRCGASVLSFEREDLRLEEMFVEHISEAGAG